MKGNFRETVAEEMIKHLESGTTPWQKPWDANIPTSRPFNPTTNKSYKGINTLWLELQGRTDPRWMTYNQAQSKGAQVRKGEKTTTIEYWKYSEEKPRLGEDGKPELDENGKKITDTVQLERPKVFYANVFNAEQIDGLEQYIAPALKFDPVDKAELVLTEANIPIIHDQGDRAFYSSMKDEVHLPVQGAFSNAYDYYATALHEIGHATGHEVRLNRDFGPFGSEVYAKEELKAEIASYMLSRELGLGHNPDRHASYVDSWVKVINDDRNFIFQAAKEAETIRSWVIEPEKRLELEKAAQRNQSVIKTKKAHTMASDKEIPAPKKNQEQDKIYLAIPFKEKEQAKALGARWDKKQKSWYAPANVPAENFKKWQLNGTKAAPLKELAPQEEFAEFLKSNMIELKGAPVMDGEWHRVSIEGEPSKKNASYRGFLDGRANGQIQNFKTGENPKWVAVGQAMTDEEKAQLQAKSAETKKLRKAELENKQTAAAKRAFGIWKNNGKWADENNSTYLKEKAVKGHGIKVTDNGNIIIPLRDIDGRVHSLQTITEDKKLFTENGRKSGLMHTIDPKRDLEKTDRIVIAEGYSTGATAHELSGKPTIVAFDSGNLKAVALAIKEKYPKAEIIFAADNDHTLEGKPPFKNVGLVKAVEAAEAVNGIVVSPKFNEGEITKGLTDWNDLARSRGQQETQALFIKDVIKLSKPVQSIKKTPEMSMAG